MFVSHAKSKYWQSCFMCAILGLSCVCAMTYGVNKESKDAAVQSKAPVVSINCTLDSDKGLIEIRAHNPSDDKLRMNSLVHYGKDRKELNALSGIYIRLKSESGELLTVNSADKQGYWTPFYIISESGELPSFDVVPGDTIHKKQLLKPLLSGLTKGRTGGIDPKQLLSMARYVEIKVVIDWQLLDQGCRGRTIHELTFDKKSSM